MTRDRLYAEHVAECIGRIERYTADGRAAFFVDEKTQDAVLRNLQTLAESTQRLSDAARARHPEIDWRAIAGFRNVVVHDYLGVDLGQIWAVVAEDLPILGDAICRMLASLDDGDQPSA